MSIEVFEHFAKRHRLNLGVIRHRQDTLRPFPCKHSKNLRSPLEAGHINCGLLMVEEKGPVGLERKTLKIRYDATKR